LKLKTIFKEDSWLVLFCQGKNENRFQDSPVSVFLFQGDAGSFFGKSPCITGSVLKKEFQKP
jgi:hypothetical protein